MSDPNVAPEAVTGVVHKLYGEDAVVFDPSDPEANRIAVYRALRDGSHPLLSAAVMRALEAKVPLREVQIAARHASTNDHRRQSFDRHAAFVVAFVARG